MVVNYNYYVYFDGFEENMKRTWQDLKNYKDFYDITLVCEDKHFKAHKFLICSFSPVLRNILKSTQTAHPLIFLRRVKQKDIQNLLEFMYQGEVYISEKDLASFLDVAEDLKVQGLSKGKINKDACDSNGVNLSKSIYHNFVPSPKGKKSKMETELKNKVNEKHSIDSFVECEQEEEKSNIENCNSNEENFSQPKEPFNEIDSFSEFEKACENVIKSEEEENGEDCNSNGENLSQPTNDNFAPSLKVQRKEREENESNSINTFAEFEQVCRNISNDHNNIEDTQNIIPIVLDKQILDCGKCDKQFTTKVGLYLHNKTIHDQIMYSCTKCEFKGKGKSHLKYHMKAIHKGERHLCDQCDYKSIQKSDLKKHIQSIHQGERFPCDQCDHKSTTKSNLLQHIRSKVHN